MKCRFCEAPLSVTFVDLGMQPLANAYVPADRADGPEVFHPLHVRVCERCLLVQLPAVVTPTEIFSDYAYLSSTSTSWLKHCGRFAEDIVRRLGLTRSDQVLEVASNDGYLLRFFAERGHPVIGVEPAANVAEIARRNGVPTVARFFGAALARELASDGARPKLIVANNVLAHVPDINDFVEGFHLLLGPGAVLSVEFPHLLELIRGNQFDTIYHEHFSYLSLGVVDALFAAHGLKVFEVEQLPSHGGSLRVLACPRDDARAVGPSVAAVLEAEKEAGLGTLAGYRRYTERVQRTKWALVEMLASLRREGKRVVGYGAPAKGNTLLNYCGVRSDLLEYTVDLNELKQGKLLPGTRIPIRAPEAIRRDRPDFVLILPWNLRREIVEQMAEVKTWGGRFIVPIPEPRLLE
jgi:SAM-dependent methyltransferase